METYQDVMRWLRDDLLAANYTVDAVLEAVTPAGQAGLERNHTMAADRALGARADQLATLTRLFILQQGVAEARVRGALDVDRLGATGLLIREGDVCRASVDIRPCADETDGMAGWVISDHVANLDTALHAPASDHVLGVSPASISLSQITSRREAGTALDLGTGSGVQSLHMVRHASQVVATDVNPRALTLATLTFALNDVQVETRLGSLYEPVDSDGFDIIATNPPFVISPKGASKLIYRETGHHSDSLMREVVSGAGRHLRPGGTLHLVGNWAYVKGQPWQERVSTWVPDGCDAFIIQREVLDVYEYIEIWLADAGLAGSAGYKAAYQTWLDYFDHCGIEAVGMGWIAMVKSGSSTPRVLCEHWPHPVTQPVAQDMMDHLAGFDYAGWSNTQLLDQVWVLADGTVQETLGQPGQEDPAHVVLRRNDGLKRAIEVDPGLGGVLGACDGELPLARILAAVAELIGEDVGTFASKILPTFRQLAQRTWVTPVKRPTGVA